MKAKIYLTILITFLVLKSNSQEIPFIKVKNEKLGISSLKVNVDVFGNIATTTYDMLFYNPTNQVLEGELNFPLGEGQNVVRLALEINGHLREAVVVEKELGRVAFEAVVRRGVDPVLLEKVTGNNYKARIYPIPANGYKRIVLAFDQNLKYKDHAKTLQLPLKFNKELDKFSVAVEVFSQDKAPIIKTNGLPLQFLKTEQSYKSTFTKEKYLLNNDLDLRLPLGDNTAAIIRNENYFYLSQPIQFTKEVREKPKTIDLFWDMSYSMQDRNIEKELKLLDIYLQYLRNVTINITTFSNELRSKKTFKITNGNWNILKTVLQSSVYDGATNYAVLEKEITNTSNTVLFFTDLMHNLSDTKLQFKNTVFIVNSISKSNHELAKQITNNNDGSYINLNDVSVTEGFQLLKNKKFELLAIETTNPETEIYPKKFQNVVHGINISGKNIRAGQKITFKFGSNQQITKTMVYEMPTKKVHTTKLDKIFVANKINFLQKDKEKNKQEIITLSKGYKVISEYTSMIVLDNVRDYLKYKIEPPADLREAYDKLLKQRNATVVAQETIKQETDKEVNEPENIQGEFIVSGVVSDAMGPVADVSVKVKGTNVGTVTDFDGRFSIRASIGNDLVFTHISYGTIETTVVGRQMHVSMQNAGSELEEVVVTALGIKRKTDELTSSTQIVKSEVLTKASAPNIVNALAGKVSGLRISKTTSGVNEENQILLRGMRSFSGNNEALIVIDGVPSSKDLLEAIDPESIESVNVLKGASGAALYGSQAANGALIITTKKGDTGTNIATTHEEEEIKVTPRNKYLGSLKVNIPKNKAAYLNAYKFLKTAKGYYNQYLIQREKYVNYPAFLVDIYDLFLEKGFKKYADRIVSNIIELDIDNYEKLKIYAYKMEKSKQKELAVFLYKKILELRPEDAQSYRDLALVYKAMHKNKEADKILETIVSGKIYKNSHRRKFKGVTTISRNEMASKHKKFDIRVVIDWNHNDTDIDLHIIEPTLEECYYGHQQTKIGGQMSMDMTQGFGPEEYTLTKAKKGIYYVKVNYYGDRYQKIENPTFIKITIFKNYGSDKETKEIRVIRMSGKSKKYILAKINVA